MSAKRAVILQHEEHEGPGLLGPSLASAGFEPVTRFRQVRREDLDAALVVSLGGGMGVYDAAAHPFLSAELAFLSERLALGRPVLGICLGAQLLAAAAGSRVFPGKNGFELGASPVRWTRAAAEDSVLAGAGMKTCVAHWHGDTFDPVPGATLLASTDRYTQQAFRLGPSFGLQFHLELTAESFAQWLEADAQSLRARGVDVEQVRGSLGKLKGAEAGNRRLLDQLTAHFARCA